MKPVLYVSDLDFTLANKSKSLSSVTKKGIQQLFDNDVKFTIATARGMSTIRSILGDISLHLPIIEYNGGLITDYMSGEHIRTNSLSSHDVSKLYELSSNIGLTPIISTITPRNILFYPKEQSEGMKIFINNRRRINDDRLVEISDLNSVFGEKILSMVYIDRYEYLSDLYKIINENFDNLSVHMYENEYSKGWWWITIHDEKSSKGNAIKQLQSIYHIDEYELVVFGDNVNDKSMFDIADRKYAVNNAINELKVIANDVIGDHESNSVINFILKENRI